MNNKSINKQINLELLRIVSMLMIIMLHLLGHGNVLNSTVPNTFSYYLTWSIEGICYIAVNCYVLISGYFLINSKFHIKKLVHLLLQVLFYTVLIYIIFCLLGYAKFTPLQLLKALTPNISASYWFVTIYVGMYVLSPFLNSFIRSMNKNKHLVCILVCVLLFSVLPSIVFYSSGLNFGGGNGIVWFITLYLIASYLKLYYIPHYSIKKYVLWYIAFTAMIPFSKFFIESSSFFSNFIGSESLFLIVDRIYQYNNFLVLIASVLFFVIFLNLSNAKLSNKILLISPLCFGVYLIHDNGFIRPLLWQKMNIAQYLGQWQFIFVMILIVFFIFIICCLIEYIRQRLFLLLFRYINIDDILERIQGRTVKYLNK